MISLVGRYDCSGDPSCAPRFLADQVPKIEKRFLPVVEAAAASSGNVPSSIMDRRRSRRSAWALRTSCAVSPAASDIGRR